MTSAATPAKCAPMSVIRLMAGIAIFRQRNLLNILIDVTCVTIEARMRACQREVGLTIVIKAPQPPTIGVVTDDASIPESTCVVVFARVACRAIERCILKRLRRMAFFARHDCMLTDQRKARDFVIE